VCEVVLTISELDGSDEVIDVSPFVLARSPLGVSHPALDLGEGLLDRIEVRRVWRDTKALRQPLGSFCGWPVTCESRD
jgi:hypothetical protein